MLKRTGAAVGKVAAVTAVMGVAVYYLTPALEALLRPALDTFLLDLLKGLVPANWPAEVIVRFVVGGIHLGLVAAAGGVIFAAGVHVLRVEEWRQAIGWVKGKLKRR